MNEMNVREKYYQWQVDGFITHGEAGLLSARVTTPEDTVSSGDIVETMSIDQFVDFVKNKGREMVGQEPMKELELFFSPDIGAAERNSIQDILVRSFPNIEIELEN